MEAIDFYFMLDDENQYRKYLCTFLSLIRLFTVRVTKLFLANDALFVDDLLYLLLLLNFDVLLSSSSNLSLIFLGTKNCWTGGGGLPCEVASFSRCLFWSDIKSIWFWNRFKGVSPFKFMAWKSTFGLSDSTLIAWWFLPTIAQWSGVFPCVESVAVAEAPS